MNSRSFDPRTHEQGWVVQWRSPQMQVPSFWYYKDKADAERSALSFLSQECEVKLRRVTAPRANRIPWQDRDRVTDTSARRE